MVCMWYSKEYQGIAMMSCSQYMQKINLVFFFFTETGSFYLAENQKTKNKCEIKNWLTTNCLMNLFMLLRV